MQDEFEIDETILSEGLDDTDDLDEAETGDDEEDETEEKDPLADEEEL